MALVTALCDMHAFVMMLLTLVGLLEEMGPSGTKGTVVPGGLDLHWMGRIAHTTTVCVADESPPPPPSTAPIERVQGQLLKRDS